MTLRNPEGLDWKEIDPGMMNANWDVKETDVEGLPAIEFSYEVSSAKLAAVGMKGPILVKKTFWLPEVPEEDRYDLASRTSHVKTRLSIENLSSESQEIAFQLNGPTGTPTEGWWYINKIHGSPTAIGYMGGTRDVTARSEKEQIHLHQRW